MKGSNQLILCQAELNTAVEFYLSEKVFKEPVKVKLVDKVEPGIRAWSSGYRVELAEAEDGAKDGQ